MLVFGKRIAFKLAVRQEVKYGEFEGHPSSTRSTEAHLKHDPQGEKRSLGSLREVDGPVRNRSRRSSGKMLDQRFRIVTRSSADSPHRSIASSGAIRVRKHPAACSQGQLQVNHSRTVATEQLNAGQPPERECFVHPDRFGGQDRAGATIEGVERKFRSVIPIRKGEARARRRNLGTDHPDACGYVFKGVGLRLASQDRVSVSVRSDTESLLMETPGFLPGHRADIVVSQIGFDTVLRASLLDAGSQHAIGELL